MFSSEYCEFFKSAYFKEHLLTTASDFLKSYKTAVTVASVLTILLSSDNLLTGYEQFSY